jgi:hypothetical protein
MMANTTHGSAANMATAVITSNALRTATFSHANLSHHSVASQLRAVSGHELVEASAGSRSAAT